MYKCRLEGTHVKWHSLSASTLKMLECTIKNFQIPCTACRTAIFISNSNKTCLGRVLEFASITALHMRCCLKTI